MRWILLCLAALTVPASAADWRSDGLCRGGTFPPEVRLQRQRGSLRCDVVGGASAILFEAGAKRGSVGKAALIVPFDPLPPGGTIVVRAEVLLPPGSPANSMILMDVECKRCGLPGNPGLRLYLRDAALRVDRSKIAGGHAWAVKHPRRVPVGQWFHLEWTLTLGDAADGRSQVALNGETVLTNQGRTMPDAGGRSAVDRVQIGITANSNDVPVTLHMRDIRIRID